MRRALAVAALLIASSATAQSDAPLAAVEDLDPMELSRAARRTGDAAVLEALEAEPPAPAAMLAAPWMRAPEAALARLVAIAGGRDPFAAPVAMQAILQIAAQPITWTGALDEEREAVLAGLETLAADERARGDLRAAAALAAGQLSP